MQPPMNSIPRRVHMLELFCCLTEIGLPLSSCVYPQTSPVKFTPRLKKSDEILATRWLQIHNCTNLRPVASNRYMYKLSLKVCL